MNGRVVLDSNIIMDLFNGNLSKENFVRALSNKVQVVSVISCIEVMAFPKITEELEKKYDLFLSRRFVIPLTEQIQKQTIKIRRNNTSIKIPDAIISATALSLDAVLLTRDDPLRKALASSLPSLVTVGI